MTEGIRIPGWAVAAVTVAVVLLLFGVRLGAQIGKNDERLNRLEAQNSGLDFRLCRIERALQIAVYQTCQP